MTRSFAESMKRTLLFLCTIVALVMIPSLARGAEQKPTEEIGSLDRRASYALVMNWDGRARKLKADLIDRNGKKVSTLTARRGPNRKDRCWVIYSIRPKTQIIVPDGWMIDSDIRFSEGIGEKGEVFRAPDGSRGRRFYSGQAILLKGSNSDITVRGPDF